MPFRSDQPPPQPPPPEQNPRREVIPPGYREWKLDNVPVEILTKETMLKQIWTQCDLHAKAKRAETGGVLLGQHIEMGNGIYKVHVDFAEAMRDPTATSTSFGFKAAEMRRINEFHQKQYPKLKQVGWYHSHLNPEAIFLSPQDRSHYETFFKEPWQIALVVQADEGKAGYFTWVEGKIDYRPLDAREFDIEQAGATLSLTSKTGPGYRPVTSATMPRLPKNRPGYKPKS